jgi:predicted acyltransferase
MLGRAGAEVRMAQHAELPGIDLPRSWPRHDTIAKVRYATLYAWRVAMNEFTPSPVMRRLTSLDAFRGITIAGMILVNNPGSWRDLYGLLGHAHWHGWTPTDLVFPFFLFIVGVAMAYSFHRRLAEGQSRLVLLKQVVRRTIILFVLGLIMAGFPDLRLIAPYVAIVIGLTLGNTRGGQPGVRGSGVGRLRGLSAWIFVLAGLVFFVIDFGHFQAEQLRVPGVLQRIAVCYLAVALISMTGGVWVRAGAVVVTLLGYWLILSLVHPPAGYAAEVTGPEGLLHDWIDVQLLGAHLYRERPDPEGLLSTLPAVGTVLLGLLTGQWLQSARESRDKTVLMFVAANVLLVLAAWWSQVLPINKKIWTSSYVLLTAGLALHFLAMCYWLLDVKGYRRWAWPFVVFGSNAIVVYVASSLMAKLMVRWTIAMPDGGTIAFKTWIYEALFASWASPPNASLLYALAYVTFWLVPMILLHQRRIFIKI